MATSAIYWWPTSSTTVTKLSLGEMFTRFRDQPAGINAASQGWGGGYKITHYGGLIRVSVSLEGFQGGQLVRDLKSLESHLLRGGAIGLAADESKTFAGYLTSSVTKGDKTLYVSNGFNYSGNPAPVLSQDDEIVVEGPPPTDRRDFLRLDSSTSSTLTVFGGARYTQNSGVVLVRNRQFYPVLRLDMAAHGDSGVLTEDEGQWNTWTLDMTLIVDREAIEAVSGQAANNEGIIVFNPDLIQEGIDPLVLPSPSLPGAGLRDITILPDSWLRSTEDLGG